MSMRGGTALYIKKRWESTDLSRVLERVWTRALEYAEMWNSRYTPRNTGRLMESMTARFDPQSLKLVIEFNAPYAEWVEEMEGVKWTNPQTKEQFTQAMFKAVKQKMMEELNKELAKLER